MNDKEFFKADTIRKANGMSEQDRIDFLLAELDEEYKADFELGVQEFTKRTIYLCVAFCGLGFFLFLSHYYGLFTIS